MGGDRAPDVTIGGARDALELYPAIERLFLVGDEGTLQQGCREQNLIDPRLEIVHAPEVVEMSESAVDAVRRKKQSSIAVATELVKEGQADAVVSAGNTGAAVAACTLKLQCSN